MAPLCGKALCCAMRTTHQRPERFTTLSIAYEWVTRSPKTRAANGLVEVVRRVWVARGAGHDVLYVGFDGDGCNAQYEKDTEG